MKDADVIALARAADIDAGPAAVTDAELLAFAAAVRKAERGRLWLALGEHQAAFDTWTELAELFSKDAP